MARKKIEPITGLGRDPESQLTVQKSRPLYSLWRSDLTLSEFKILDTYLSRIDSHKPDKRTVVFEKGKLEDLLGVKQIKPDVLDDRLKHLMTTVKIDDDSTKRGFTRIALFEKAVLEQDESGLWQAELTCTQSAMKYVFNIDSIGYLRYKLRCITSITSRYSYILFMYLEKNRFRKTWIEDLQELKEILNCENEETYKQFKRFNDRLLKRCHKEINEKTECKYDYEPVKKGRSVVAVRFTVTTLPPLEPAADPNQYTIEGYLNDMQRDVIMLLQDACKLNDEPEFSPEQTAELLALIQTVPERNLPQVDFTANIDIRRYHYLTQKYATLNRVAATKQIKHRYQYLVKIIKTDIKEE